MATYGSRNLQKGSTGSDVRTLQTNLNTLGFDCGKVDGIFGTSTLAAVKKFQQKYNLGVDGVVGKNTFKKLEELLTSKKITTTTRGTSKSSVTLSSGSAPTVAKDELRIGIQTKPVTSRTVNTSTQSNAAGTVSNTTTITTATDQTVTNIYYPPIEGDVTWDTERTGSPGKLSFKIRGDIDISEGDIVSVTYGDTKVFVGYIFSREFDKSGVISVTAYDQLRYLKNNDTYVFSNIKASDLIKRIAKDYNMDVGTIEDTAIVIPSVIEDDQPLLDIIYNALDKTTVSSNKVFVFYDEYGKLTLRSLDSMRSNLLLDEETVADYSYNSSIDDEVYNQIVLYYDNSETNKREYFTATSASSVANWGLLRKSESIDANVGAQNLADLYLAMYNKKVRKLSIKDAFGRPDVRAGTLVPVIMKVGEVNLRNFMLVEKATHTWSNGKYVMNLDLAGAGEFSV